MVGRHILARTRRNGDDLAAVKARLDRLEPKVGGLIKRLPKIVRDAVRVANRECRRT